MQLTPNFDLDEFTASPTAAARGIDNTPSATQIECARALCSAILEPLRERVGGPILINSGIRSAALNKAIGGSDTSQHMKGEAADIRTSKVAITTLWRHVLDMVAAKFPIDQAIIYPRVQGAGWIHISHTASRISRRELLVSPPGGGYTPWSRWSGPLILPAGTAGAGGREG